MAYSNRIPLPDPPPEAVEDNVLIGLARRWLAVLAQAERLAGTPVEFLEDALHAEAFEISGRIEAAEATTAAGRAAKLLVGLHALDVEIGPAAGLSWLRAARTGLAQMIAHS